MTDFAKTAFEAKTGLEGVMQTEIELGNPRSPDCANFGICRIFSLEGKAMSLLPSCCPNRAQGYIRRWERHGIELIFPKENMATATLEKHFGSGWFSVEDAYHLPTDLAARLGIASFDFEPGRYPVLEMAGRLHVIFS